jgi:hypothetical protein
VQSDEVPRTSEVEVENVVMEIIDNRSSSREVDGADTWLIPFFFDEFAITRPQRGATDGIL